MLRSDFQLSLAERPTVLALWRYHRLPCVPHLRPALQLLFKVHFSSEAVRQDNRTVPLQRQYKRGVAKRTLRVEQEKRDEQIEKKMPCLLTYGFETWAAADIFPGGGNVEILLVLFRLLTMQCKWTFTKRITLSSPLVCAGCTSVLNLLSELFSTLRLSEILFLFISCSISIFWARAANSHNLRKINGQNNTCGEKTKNLDTLAKLLQAMRSRNICWQDYRTTLKS